MEKVPHGSYTKEWYRDEEVVKKVTDGGFSLVEICNRLSLP